MPNLGATVTSNNGTMTTVQRTVWKYALTKPAMRFSMPADARVIDVQTQAGDPTLWVLATLTGEVREREFLAYGTGHPIPVDDRLTYVGSAHNVEGAGLVFHIFERTIR